MSKHHPHCPALRSHQEKTTKKTKTSAKSKTFTITDQKHTHKTYLWNSLNILPNNLLLTTGSEGSLHLWDISKSYTHIHAQSIFTNTPILSSTYIRLLNTLILSSNEYSPIKSHPLSSSKPQKSKSKPLETPKLTTFHQNPIFSFNKVLYIEP
jgi:hypothetical protein